MNTITTDHQAAIEGACAKYHRAVPKEWTPLGVGEWLVNPDNVEAYFSYLTFKEKKKYIYMLTFTLKPEAVGKAKEAEDFVRAQADRKALGITSYSYVKELTKAGVPHFHAVIETEIPLKKNRFQYYEKIYGKVDFSRTKGQTNQEALEYISKDSVPIVLL